MGVGFRFYVTPSGWRRWYHFTQKNIGILWVHMQRPPDAYAAASASCATTFVYNSWSYSLVLIPCRYSSCFSCCSCSWASFCWGDALQKSLRLRRFKSDRVEIRQDCSSGWLSQSNFRFDVILLRWRPWHPPSARCYICSKSAGCPLAHWARVYSCWCIVHWYFFDLEPVAAVHVGFYWLFNAFGHFWRLSRKRR